MEVEWPTYTVCLVSVGEDRLRVIITLRKLWPSIGLLQAKKLVDRAPQIVASELRHCDIDLVRNALHEAGAVIEIIDDIHGKVF